MKVFFDTNVYAGEVSGGIACQAVLVATSVAGWCVYTSRHVVEELTRVIVERLNLSRRTAHLAGRRVGRRAMVVDPRDTRRIVPDDPVDTPVLRAALFSGADYLVTNDRHLLSLDPYEKLRIVSLASYYRLLEERGLL